MIELIHGDYRECMAMIAKYIDSSEVEAHLAGGWSVKFCRFYQFDKVCYLAMKDDNEQEN